MLIRQTATYMGSNIVTAALGFAAAIVFTRLYTPADYGVYIISNSIGGILSAAFFAWVRLSVLRFESEGEAADIRSNALVAYLASAGLLILTVPLTLMAFGMPWQQSVGSVMFAITIALFEMELELLRAKQEVMRYAIGACSRAIAMLGLGCLFYTLGLGGFGLVLSIATAYMVGALILAPRAWRLPLPHFDAAVMRRMLAFGLPAMLGGLALSLHAATDRIIVTTMLGEAMGGQYGVAADLTRQIILVPAMALGSAVVPMAVRTFATKGQAAARGHLADSGELMLAMLLPAVVGLSLTGHDLADLIVGEKFRDTAALLIPILSFVWLFQAMTQNYVHVGFHIAARSRGMIYQGLISLAANLVFIIPLTWAYGIAGAACAAVLAEAIGFFAGFKLARAVFPLPLEPVRLLRIGGAAAAMAIAVSAISWLAHAAMPGASAAMLLALKATTGVVAYGIATVALDVASVRTRFLASRHPPVQAEGA